MSGERWRKQTGTFSFMRKHLSESDLRIPSRKESILFDFGGQQLSLEKDGWSSISTPPPPPTTEKPISIQAEARIKSLEEKNNQLIHKYELVMEMVNTLGHSATNKLSLDISAIKQEKRRM
eukprot:TRINITY_DN10296_c0_g1_i2.p1 TRINITY_DN10296_c0_g1~~TRINITY_DN10296_c0_g1_i2.p1  ORF type:complete len:121 (+),score=33.66 TRINITY_DN10296_c0_g1_i2:50-412(+)